MNHYFFIIFIMDRYKQGLCLMYFDYNCLNEEEIFNYATEDLHEDYYKCNLNADGKLHSRYLEEFGCYEPAIIYRESDIIYLYWLFDGEIKDCLHPFVVKIDISESRRYIYSIHYYSLERIQHEQPVHLIYLSDCKIDNTAYNNFIWNGKYTTIIDDSNIPSYYTSNPPAPYDKLDMSEFVTIAPGIICPLWSDEFASDSGLFKFKFED